MIPAQEWYEFQKNYERYGLDFDAKKEKPQKVHPARKKTKVTARDKVVMLLVVAVIGVMMLAGIAMTAYSASLNYSVNEITAENQELQGEVETLSIKIQSEGSIQAVEKRAAKELRMVTPSEKRCIYLKSGK